MSEDPEGLCIIAGGYAHLIKRQIFDNQPGLESRFVWKFDCPGYNIEELYQIFLYNLGDRKIREEDLPEIKDMFHANEGAFPAMARDVDNLIFYIDVELDSGDLSDPEELSESKETIITLEVMKVAFETLKRNNADIDKKEVRRHNPLMDLFESMSSR
jgi:hypothetical protein